MNLIQEDFLKKWLKENKYPNFRETQIIHELYKNQNTDYEDMTTLPQDLRNKLQENFDILSLKLDNVVESDDTTKFSFLTKDWNVVETVIMYHWKKEKHLKDENKKLNRITLCVSSQVGCAVNCIFCVTGKLWFTRDLSYDEIISQVLFANNFIKKKFGKKEDWTLFSVRNIVFMWMWEPFLNYEEVKKSIEIMLEQKRFSLSKRHITISTCGILPGIKQMIDDDLNVKLAVSLHAPNQELRTRIMPIAAKYDLNDLMDLLDLYVEKTDNRIFYEYIMIKEINDSDENAKELISLLKNQLCHVNLIPYNENPVINLQESSRNRIYKFKDILEKGWITVTVRDSLWRETKWACGQLWYEKIKK